MYNPEYISKGSTILLREGRTKIMGMIVNVGVKSQTEDIGVPTNLIKEDNTLNKKKTIK